MSNGENEPLAKKLRSSSSNIKVPNAKTFECTVCKKVFTKHLLLSEHMKNHLPLKEENSLKCNQCLKTFSTHLLLNAHSKTRKNCNLVSTSTAQLENSCVKSPLKSPWGKKLQCTDCNMTFSTHALLFKHKVVKHGVETPDKKVKEPNRKNVYKGKGTHGGIPLNAKFKKAYENLRLKLDD